MIPGPDRKASSGYVRSSRTAAATRSSPSGSRRWISGPSLNSEPVSTADVRIGDRLLYDAAVVTVTDIRDGFFWLETGQEPGIALGWRSGSASGLIFRKATDLMERVTS